MARLAIVKITGFLILALLIPFGFAKAEHSQEIYISEVAWAGSSFSTADEFVELYNVSDHAINLSDYSLWDETIINPESKVLEPKLMLLIEDGQIAPKGHFLISNYSLLHDKSVLNVEADVIDTHLSLSNDHLKISLRNPQGKVVDTIGDAGKPFYYSEISALATTEGDKYKASIERRAFEDGSLASSWEISLKQENIKAAHDLMNPQASGRFKLLDFSLADVSYVLGVSKVEHFSYVTDRPIDKISVNISGDHSDVLELLPTQLTFDLPTSSTCYKLAFTFFDHQGLSRQVEQDLKCFLKNDQLNFSEVLSAPKDYDWNSDGKFTSGDEWFELKNFWVSSYSLDGWQVCDASEKCYALSGSIEAGGYIAIFSSQSKLSLNNTAETLRLIDPSGEQIDSVAVPTLDYNIAYAKLNDWQKTNRPTPAKANLASDTPAAAAPQQLEPVVEEARTESIVEEPFVESARETVVIETIIDYDLQNFLDNLDERQIAKLDGSMVAGDHSYRLSDPFNFWPFLIYLLLVSVWFASVIGIYNAFYRRE